MSHLSHADQSLPVHLSSSGRRIAVLSRLIEQLICRLATRNGIAELRAMDDRCLTDIGITRQQVEYLAGNGRWPAIKRHDRVLFSP